MSKKVPYLHEEQIERDAAALLAEFSQTRGVVIAAPIPIEDIVEKHLKLGIDFDDMHRLLNHPRSSLSLDPDSVAHDHGDPHTLLADLAKAETETTAYRDQLKAILAEALAR